MSENDFHKKLNVSGLPTGNKSPEGGQDVPKMVGPYKIESLLEKGGMSVLYLATQPNTKEPTTIKVLSPRLISHPEAVQRFLNEAHIIGMTDHPNIVKLYGQGEWEGGLYIAMEFIQGVSLRQSILQSPISLKRAIEIIIDIAYALCHLHTHGVIHRDLKPENVLITETSQVKVIDFGIAQLLAEQSAPLMTEQYRLIGTPIYMSPEQRENPESVSYPSDIYSLGIIAYELILGKLSHGHIHLSLMPKGIQKILNKTLQPKPEDRYQDVVDFINDFSAYLHSGNMQKEKKVGDHLSELSENLWEAQKILAPEHLPEWKGVELGLAQQASGTICGIYYDCLTLEDGSYGIIIGESFAKGAEGIIHTATLRGMIRALEHLANQPSELLSQLNTLMIQDRIRPLLTLSYLLLSPQKNTLSYISSGNTLLWRIAAYTEEAQLIAPIKATTFGVDPKAQFKGLVTPWKPNDTLIYHSFAPQENDELAASELSQATLKKTIQEITFLSPQKIVEAISRKLSVASSKTASERSLLWIAIRRKE